MLSNAALKKELAPCSLCDQCDNSTVWSRAERREGCSHACVETLTDCLLDQSITRDIYAKKRDEQIDRQVEITRLLEQHHTADRDFKTSLTALVSLSSRIASLFDSSQPEEKRKLIGFVFSNLELDGQKLRFTLRKPFDLFVNLSEGQEWRPLRDSNPCYRRERAMS